MEVFDFSGIHPGPHVLPGDATCTPDLTEALTAAHVSQGMDPLHAALEAQLQAPLIQPFLF